MSAVSLKRIYVSNLDTDLVSCKLNVFTTLIARNICVELQKDLVQPVVISSTMAHDTFLRDRVLCHVAEQRQQRVRKSDIALRWGGEEFLFPRNNCGLNDAQLIAEKICQRVAEIDFEVDGQAGRAQTDRGCPRTCVDGVKYWSQTCSSD